MLDIKLSQNNLKMGYIHMYVFGIQKIHDAPYPHAKAQVVLFHGVLSDTQAHEGEIDQVARLEIGEQHATT